MDLHFLEKSRWPQVAMILSYFPALKDTNPPYAAGTATLINPGAILTAAHVAFDPSPDRGGSATMFDVFFGNGTFVKGIPGGNARVLDQYKANAAASPSAFDASVILLGTRVNGITPASVTPSLATDLQGFLTNVVGYPAEGVDSAGQSLFGRMYGAEDVARVDPGLNNGFSIEYPIPTLGGMSGGPVYRTDEAPNGIFIRAVHTSLLTNGDGNGLIMYESLANQISAWVLGR